MVAASLTGGVFVPIDPRTRGEKLAETLRNSECRGIVCADYALAQVAAVRGLSATAEFPTALLPPDIVEAELRSILDVQRRQSELVNQARGLAALGLIRPGFDLPATPSTVLPIMPAVSTCRGRT